MKWLITTFVALLVLTALQPWLKTYTECVHMLRSMSAAYVVDKVRRLANVALDAEQSERLITTVQNLDALQDLSTLVPLLVREHGRA
jgi:hypothetical protein